MQINAFSCKKVLRNVAKCCFLLRSHLCTPRRYPALTVLCGGTKISRLSRLFGLLCKHARACSAARSSPRRSHLLRPLAADVGSGTQTPPTWQTALCHSSRLECSS